jgi:hypothetical protein
MVAAGEFAIPRRDTARMMVFRRVIFMSVNR